MDVSQAVTIIQESEPTLALLSAAADTAARRSVLSDYRERISAETARRQKADIALFQQFLTQVAELAGMYVPADMADNLCSWSGISAGTVKAFVRWMLDCGYAIGSINVRLATIKAYCELAYQAGELSAESYTLIKTVKGYRNNQGRNIDEKREQTRTGYKKASPVSISPAHAALLKHISPDPAKSSNAARARAGRDALLMCLLLDHGLRCGEIASLNVADISVESATMTFYRHKVNLTQTHLLTPDTLQAAQAYLSSIAPDQEALFTGVCSRERVNERSLNHRVSELGKQVGLAGLSPHDCRHYWATQAIRSGTDIKSLQDAGGWSSPVMPLRYAESSKIANSGVKL